MHTTVYETASGFFIRKKLQFFKLHRFSEAFGGAIIWNFDIEPTDGTTMLEFVGARSWTPVYGLGVQSTNLYATSPDV